MKRIPLTEATAKQLADFATLVCGIPDVNYRLGGAAILAKIEAAGYGDATIEVEDNATVAQPAAERQAPASGRRMITIRIDTSEGAGGSKPVPVGVNGKVMLIPRGKEVSVPYEYYHALKNAKMTVTDPIEDGKGGLHPPRDVPSYPVSVVA